MSNQVDAMEVIDQLADELTTEQHRVEKYRDACIAIIDMQVELSVMDFEQSRMNQRRAKQKMMVPGTKSVN